MLVYDLSRYLEHSSTISHPVHHAMAMVVNGVIYVFGGYVTGWIATTESWAYNPAADIGVPKAAMPHERAAGGAVAINGKIHLVGGSNSGRGNIAARDPSSNN
ncbi:hypothetical protein HER21_16805 [Pseudomonas sp. BGM005]|nr:hypothetical protein [Pseudomonas sp. BG5]